MTLTGLVKWAPRQRGGRRLVLVTPERTYIIGDPFRYRAHVGQRVEVTGPVHRERFESRR